MQRVGLGAGSKGEPVSRDRFQEIVRGGAEALGARRGTAERDRIPVDDDWDIPKDSRAWRGQKQLGSLGGGNHFIELQHGRRAALGHVPHRLARLRPRPGHVLLRAGERGAGPRAAARWTSATSTPRSRHWRDYRNAVAAGGNFAIANRLLIGTRRWGAAFAETFGEEPELVYEISHNLVQEENHPDLFDGPVWVHRKGATRALPAGHPMLAGTRWENTGHPVLIPGSMGDASFVLRPLPGAARSLYSVNHGCGTPQVADGRQARDHAGGGRPAHEGPRGAGELRRAGARSTSPRTATSPRTRSSARSPRRASRTSKSA